MGYLTDADYDDLPEDNGAAFSALEGLSRDRLHSAERDERGDMYVEDLLRYMNEISAIAAEFELQGVEWDEDSENHYREFARFTRAVDAKLAQIRIQRARRNKNNSVALSGNSRQKMQHYLENLKAEVASSNLPDRHKNALLDKIREFEIELAKPRFNMALALSFVAMVTTIAHDGGETLVAAPNIVKSVLQIFHTDKQAEDDAKAALPRYVEPKKLKDHREPAPARPPKSTSTQIVSVNSTKKLFRDQGGFGDDLDDVPF